VLEIRVSIPFAEDHAVVPDDGDGDARHQAGGMAGEQGVHSALEGGGILGDDNTGARGTEGERDDDREAHGREYTTGGVGGQPPLRLSVRGRIIVTVDDRREGFARCRVEIA
jgi:hypothetical protein